MKEMRSTVGVQLVEMRRTDSRRLWDLVSKGIVLVVSFECAFRDQKDAFMKG